MSKSLERQIASLEERIEHLQARLIPLRKRLHLENRYMRVPEVSRMIGVSSQTVIRMIGDGILRAQRQRKRGPWLITKRSIKKLHDNIVASTTRTDTPA
jgi:hypothetical protein